MALTNRTIITTWPLAATVLLNYAAQVPYYLHQYYFPYHTAPALVGTGLLALTFVWFLAGYGMFIARRPYGRAVLLSFLATQILFYSHAIALGVLTGGGAVAQLRTASTFLLIIFAIGYLNFAVAVGYAVWLIALKGSKHTV